MKEKSGRFSRSNTGRVRPLGHSPVKLLLLTLLGILIAEASAAGVVYFVQAQTYTQILLIDIVVMILLIFPLLYFFTFRPLLEDIEKRWQAARQVQEKEELQQRFFNSSSVMIAYMDQEFDFIQVNDAYARAAGHPPDYFPGKNHFDLYPHTENEEIFRRVLATGEPYTVFDKPFEYSDQPELGVTYWNWDLQPVMGIEGAVEGLVLSLVDVTDRKRAQQAVELERTRLKLILDTTPNGIYIVNSDFDIEYANPVIEKEFGPLNGKKCFDYFRARETVCEDCPYAKPSSQKNILTEWFSAKTGKTYEIFGTVVENSDRTVSNLNILHDITGRKQAEEELQKRNRALQALNDMEHRQREISETLRIASSELAHSLEMDTVLKTLLRHTRTLIQADAASVLFLEEYTVLKVRAVEAFEEGVGSNIPFLQTLECHSNPFFQKLVTTRKSLLVSDVQNEPDWVVYPGTESIRNLLLIPIIIENNMIGVIGVGKMQPGHFTQDHVHWAEVLVAQAAVAIQNAWLFEQVQAGRERQQHLSRRLVDFQESERRFIAYELHDQAGQVLTSLLLGLGNLERASEQDPKVQAQTKELKALTYQVLEDLHRLAVNLRPAGLDHLGLIPAVEQMIKTFAQNPTLSIRLKTRGFAEDERFPDDVETNLYRITQEALTNAIRHASATCVDIILEKRNGSIMLIVEDDGKGFDMGSSSIGEHLGLFSMQERAEMLHGSLTIESVPGNGTTLLVEIHDVNTDIAGR